MKPLTYLTTVFFVLFGFAQVSPAQQYRIFANTSGKEIKAAIVTATDTEVTLKMENGRVIKGGINFFSEKDQKYIRKWLADNPPQVDYDFDIVATKDREDRRESKRGSTFATYEKWVYRLKIENRSKVSNSGADVSGLTMQYNVVMTPKANISSSSSSGMKGLGASGRHRIKRGSVSLPPMKYLGESEVATGQFPLNKSELAPGYYYTDGSKDEREDDLEGIWVRIMKDDAIVFEKQIGTLEVERIKWTNP